jgi:putative nucleotidyltransferase with HDIG domain
LNAEPPVAFTVGLLHDIGKLVLGQTLTADLQAEIRRQIEHGKLSRTEAEKAVLGTDHAEVGALLLQKWHLPDNLVEAVANHHQPGLKPRPQLSVVTHLANSIAHLAGSAPGWDGYAVRISDAVVTHLAITPEQTEQLVFNVRESSDRVDQFMNLA